MLDHVLPQALARQTETSDLCAERCVLCSEARELSKDRLRRFSGGMRVISHTSKIADSAVPWTSLG